MAKLYQKPSALIKSKNPLVIKLRSYVEEWDRLPIAEQESIEKKRSEANEKLALECYQEQRKPKPTQAKQNQDIRNRRIDDRSVIAIYEEEFKWKSLWDSQSYVVRMSDYSKQTWSF